MRTINNSTISALNTGFRTIYMSAFDKAEPIAEEVADIRTSGSLKEAVAIVAASARMREWIGEREVRNFAAKTFEIENKDWESTVEVDRNDIEDDRLNIYRPQIADMGRNAALVWDDLVLAALVAGTSTLCFDGQYFFDTDHAVDMFNSASGSQANLFTSRPLTQDNYSFVRAAMMSYRAGQDNRALRVNPNVLLVGPTNEVTAREIVGSENTSDGFGGTKTNVQRGSAKVIVHGEIGTEWYLIDARNQERPIILSRRKSPEFVAKIDPTDDSVFWRRKYHYGVDARGVAGYGPWWLAAKATA
jgi:phage major head subunit gpT-like protein